MFLDFHIVSSYLRDPILILVRQNSGIRAKLLWLKLAKILGTNIKLIQEMEHFMDLNSISNSVIPWEEPGNAAPSN